METRVQRVGPDARDVSHCDQRHQPDVGGLGGDDGADLPITGGRRGSGGSFQGRAIPAVQHRLSSDRRVDHNASIDLLGTRARLPEREVWNESAAASPQPADPRHLHGTGPHDHVHLRRPSSRARRLDANRAAASEPLERRRHRHRALSACRGGVADGTTIVPEVGGGRIRFTARG